MPDPLVIGTKHDPPRRYGFLWPVMDKETRIWMGNHPVRSVLMGDWNRIVKRAPGMGKAEKRRFAFQGNGIVGAAVDRDLRVVHPVHVLPVGRTDHPSVRVVLKVDGRTVRVVFVNVNFNAPHHAQVNDLKQLMGEDRNGEPWADVICFAELRWDLHREVDERVWGVHQDLNPEPPLEREATMAAAVIWRKEALRPTGDPAGGWRKGVGPVRWVKMNQRAIGWVRFEVLPHRKGI